MFDDRVRHVRTTSSINKGVLSNLLLMRNDEILSEKSQPSDLSIEKIFFICKIDFLSSLFFKGASPVLRAVRLRRKCIIFHLRLSLNIT